MEMSLDENDLPQFRTLAYSEIRDTVSCRVCGGTLCDAVTNTDCFHSYCRECIEAYVGWQLNSKCPVEDCRAPAIPPSNPTYCNLKADAFLQVLATRLTESSAELMRDLEAEYASVQSYPDTINVSVEPQNENDAFASDSFEVVDLDSKKNDSEGASTSATSKKSVQQRQAHTRLISTSVSTVSKLSFLARSVAQELRVDWRCVRLLFRGTFLNLDLPASTLIDAVCKASGWRLFSQYAQKDGICGFVFRLTYTIQRDYSDLR